MATESMIENDACHENATANDEVCISPSFAQIAAIRSAFKEVKVEKDAMIPMRIAIKDGRFSMMGSDSTNVRLAATHAYIDGADGMELDVMVDAAPLLDALKAVKKKAQGVDILVRDGRVRCRYYEMRGKATESTSFALEPVESKANFARTIEYVSKNVKVPGDDVVHIEVDTAELARMCKASAAFNSNYKDSLSHSLRFRAAYGAWTAQDSDGGIVMRPATFKSNVEGSVDRAMYSTDYMIPALGAMGKTATLMMKDEFPAIIRGEVDGMQVATIIAPMIAPEW